MHTHTNASKPKLGLKAQQPADLYERWRRYELDGEVVPSGWTKERDPAERARDILQRNDSNHDQALYYAGKLLEGHDQDDASRAFWRAVCALLQRWKAGTRDGDKRRKRLRPNSPLAKKLAGTPAE